MANWLNDQVNTAAEPDIGVTVIATLFENIGSVVRAADDEIEEHDYMVSSSSAYSIMASLLDMALVYEWLDDEDQWRQIIDLFSSRSGELVGEMDGVDVLGTLADIPPEKATAIAGYIIRSWVANSDIYRLEEFTADEKVFMIRGILIGLRNQGYLDYDPWLKTLLASLRADWQLLGGGFGNNMGGGAGGWSAAGGQ